MNAPTQDQGDRLLWMLGGAVALVAVVTVGLVFWPSGDSRAPVEEEPAFAVAAIESGSSLTAPAGDDATRLATRLNRARLALDAGMLLEPPGFSAWSLYSDILNEAPDHPAAAAGMRATAAALVDRARLAASEGRDEEAGALVDQVLAYFPDHDGARSVRDRARISVAATAPLPSPSPPARQPRPAAPALAVVSAPPQPNRAPEIDPPAARNERVVEQYLAFTRALAAGSLITPPEQSAEHFVNELRTIDPIHAMTRDAEQQLFDALFARHESAFDALDTTAALEWLAAADGLAVDAQRIAAARQALVDFIDLRAASPLISVTALINTNYVSPSYPPSAERRGLEGWVDVEFLLDVDGLPRDVTAVGSSNPLFEKEAVDAVAQWRFEPYRVAGRAIEQAVEAHIRFVIQ